MADKKKGVVVFLDLLGFRGLYQRLAPDQIIQSWQQTINTFEIRINQFEEFKKKSNMNFNIKSYSFSDTIIVYFEVPIDKFFSVPSWRIDRV